MAFRADVFAWFPDGTVRRISPGDGVYYQACINPEGSQVAFYGGASGPLRIWRSSLASLQCGPITDSASGALHPVYSWDGRQIAFASDRSVNQPRCTVEEMRAAGRPALRDATINLYMMDSNGDHVRQVTSGSYQDSRPCFSPDGQTIVFVSNRGGPPRLWTVPARGGAEPAALHTDGWGYRPWFSADGASVYFFTDVGGRHQICRIPVGGGQWEPIANDDQGTSRGPSVEWGGERLLMHSTRGSEPDSLWSLWEIPLDGSEPRMLRPPGFERPMVHGTRARNGVIAFDSDAT